MDNLQIFENSNFGKIRMVEHQNEPYFVATDICKALEIANTTQAVSRLDEDEKSMLNIGLSGGATNCVNEYGLYNLVLASRKKEAKEFKRWITHEVLPTIRKHGMYAKDELLENPDMFISVLQELKAEREKKKLLQQKIEEDKPKTIFADAVSTSKTSILIGDLAKLICQNGVQIGQKRLFEWMRQNNFLIKSGSSRNMPTQRYVEQGLFEVKESNVQNPDGSVRITKTTKVTGKGQIYFVNRFIQSEAKGGIKF